VAFRRFLLSAVVVLAASATWAGAAQARANGACVVKITRFGWEPSTVHGGDRTKLVLGVRNCTDRPLDITVTEFGKQIPPCPVLDPIGSSATLQPAGRYRPPPLRMIAPACTGVEVMVVRLADSHGRVLAHRTATLQITTPELSRFES